MSEKVKAQVKKSGKKIFYLAVLACIGGVVFFGLKSFAGTYVFDAQMRNEQKIGVSDQIEIDFNQPVMYATLDNIRISPFVGFSYSIAENRRTMTIVPNADLAPGQKYEVSLSGMKGISGFLLEDKDLVFYTKALKADPVTVPVVAPVAEQFSEISLAMSKYTPPESSRVKEDFHPQAHITTGKYIDVSLSHQVMTIFEDGKEVNQFLVSTGKYGMATPQGEFAVKSKEKNHWSVKYKLWMPFSLNFSGPYFIHELPYWPNGYREGEAHLGKKVSHGCVRLGIGPAEYVFNWADIGTPIYIHQ